MGVGEYLLGMLLLVVALAPVAAGAVAVRVRLAPGWRGAPARLAEIVTALGIVTAVAEVLGTAGVLERVRLVAGLVLAGAGAAALARRGAASPAGSLPSAPSAPAPDRLGVAVAAAAAVLVFAQWGVEVIESLGHGMLSSDTVSYHGPVAARFLQDGSITPLEFVYSDPIIPFLPFGSELLHAVAAILIGRDVASPFLNLGWLGLAMLAAWCIGRPRGLGPASLLAVCPLLASPALVTSQAGSAGTDIAAGALTLAAAALLLNAGWRTGPVALGGLAAGLALGVKVTAIAPVLALAAGAVLAAPRAARIRVGAAFGGMVVVAGSFWYLRNLFRVGNPFPAKGIDLGFVSLPSPPLPQTYTVAHYLTDGDVWRDFYLRGLNAAFGELWWALLALVLIGVVGALVTGGRLERVLGAAALASVLVYLVTPRGADGPEGVPFFFVYTLRYMTPGLAIALALLPLVRPLNRLARNPALYVGLMTLVFVALLDSGIGIDTGDKRRVALAVGLGALVALGAWGAGRVPRPLLAAGAIAGAVVLVAGYPVQRHYLDKRYASDPLAFARNLEDQRIGVVGFVRAYPLFGNDLSNRVEQVAKHGPHGAFVRIRGCRAWRAALAAGGYRYVVTSPPLLPYTAEGVIFGPAFDPKTSPEAGWTRSDPAAHEVSRSGKITVFRLQGRPDPDTCGQARTG